MFITNELIRSSISNTPNIVQSSLLDIETFSKDAHKEIISTIHEGMSTATERIKYDLESKQNPPNDACHASSNKIDSRFRYWSIAGIANTKENRNRERTQNNPRVNFKHLRRFDIHTYSTLDYL